ncbi:MAG: M14 family metallopeptidase [Vicinamibacterales bacterium]
MRHARIVMVFLAALGTVGVAQDAPDLRTRAELTAYEETSSYDDVLRLVDGIVEQSRLAKWERFGDSEEGRALPLLMLSDPAIVTPDAAARLGRPVVLVMANIHGGEVEGKEAAIILARRLALGDLQPLLKKLVVLIAPIYNADGNERVGPEHRASQNGPVAGVGTRENAKGLDLNRDYMKLESAESRALMALLARWDPLVTVDLHTTDGSYHGFHLTYSPTLNPNADPRLIELERDRLLPAIREAVKREHGFDTYYYGNFVSENGGAREGPRVDPDNPGDTVWRTFDHRPRYGNNYLGLRNRVAILSEAYSYLDFEGRVRATEAFVEETLNAVAANAARIVQLTSRIDRETVTMGGQAMPVGNSAAARRARAAREQGVRFELKPLPDLATILVGDVETRANPRSGLEMRMRTDMAVPVQMKDYGVFEPTRSVMMPRGWILPKGIVESGRLDAALERLKLHGVEVQRVLRDATVDVERFVIVNVDRAEQEIQGHREVTITGNYDAAKLLVQAGALYVSARQPLSRLAFYLMQPESDDGFVTWGIISDGIAPGETFPIYRVTAPGALRVQ